MCKRSEHKFTKTELTKLVNMRILQKFMKKCILLKNCAWISRFLIYVCTKITSSFNFIFQDVFEGASYMKNVQLTIN